MHYNKRSPLLIDLILVKLIICLPIKRQKFLPYTFQDLQEEMMSELPKIVTLIFTLLIEILLQNLALRQCYNLEKLSIRDTLPEDL